MEIDFGDREPYDAYVRVKDTILCDGCKETVYVESCVLATDGRKYCSQYCWEKNKDTVPQDAI